MSEKPNKAQIAADAIKARIESDGRLRVAPAHRDLLAEYVIPLNTPERREAYRSGEFARAEKVQDLNRRYRWDLLWIAQASRGATLLFFVPLDVLLVLAVLAVLR